MDGYKGKDQFYAGKQSASGYRTGHVINVLGTATYLYSATYYDEKGQPVNEISGNHLGGYDSKSTVYSFTGKPVKVSLNHSAPSQTDVKETYAYIYDHADRLLKIGHQLHNFSVLVIVLENTYDEQGRLSSKRHHRNSNLESNYTYNIRNWVTKISGPRFTEKLYYYDRLDGIGTPYYNGNISGFSWTAGNETVERKYHFTYDGLDRLTNAQYRQSDGRNDIYNTSYQYNKMGSIVHLSRTGLAALPSVYDCIDDLAITYNGNQLNRVTEYSTDNPLYSGAFNFNKIMKVFGADEYAYDKNGNLVKDINKQISKIEYNPLNLPSHIEFGVSGKHIKYLYDADGVKRNVQHYVVPSLVVTPVPDDFSGGLQIGILRPGTSRATVLRPGSDVAKPSVTMFDLFTTDYCGNVIYENGELSKILIPDGYIQMSGMTAVYHYYLQDHQGNNRVVAKQDGSVIEVNHFYPYGGLFGESVGTNKQDYKFGGKELDRMHGLDWSDFGGRYMRFDVPGWTSVDPLCEKYYSVSPYAYCLGNPIKNVDPDGRFVGTIIGTAIGAVKGAYDAHKNGKDVWAGAAEGAVAGAITGVAIDIAVGATVASGGSALLVMGAGALAGSVAGAGGAIAGDIVGQVVTGMRTDNTISQSAGNISTTNFAGKAKQGAIDGVISGISGGLLGIVGKAASTSSQAVQKTMSKNIMTTATTLNSQGASQETVSKAVNGITKGMGNTVTNTNKSMIKIEGTSSVVTETINIIKDKKKDHE